jgi:hypothetical protein
MFQFRLFSGTAYLTGLNLAIPSMGSGQNIPVYVTYSPVGIFGTASGSFSSISLTYIKYIDQNNGIASVSTPSILAPTMKLVGSKACSFVN